MKIGGPPPPRDSGTTFGCGLMMILLVIAVLALMMLLSGCQQKVEVWTDPLTGCQYIKLGHAELEPRLDRQGKHVCRDALP